MIRDGTRRVVIQAFDPQIDGGRFPIKRVVGEKVVVQADIFADGHDLLSCLLLYRKKENADWMEVPMKLLANDRWQGTFVVREVGTYLYTIQSWVDEFQSWRRGLSRKAEAGQDVREPVRVVADPAVVLHGRMRGVGSVRDVVAEDAGVVDDALLDPRALVLVGCRTPPAELHAQPLREFEDREWQNADFRRRKTECAERVREREPGRCVQDPV